EDGTLTLELTLDPFEIHLFSVHTACPANVCSDIACHTEGPTQIDVEAGTTYWIRVATRAADTGAFTLTIDGPGCVDGVADEVDACVTAEPVCPGELGLNRLYGFGRDELESEDANFWDSGDTEENSLTPVGWFDGGNTLADGDAATRASQNAYGLFDMCGNAGEWMQDQGGTAMTRSTRGGNWQTIGPSPLLNNLTRFEDQPSAARAFTGFRIVQSKGDISIQVTPDTNVAASGPVGGPFVVDAGSSAYTMQVPGAALTSEYDVSTGADWLTLNGEGQSVRGVIEPPLPGQPDLTVDIEISFNEETDILGAPPAAIVEMAIVSAGDVQPDGPMYSFRIARHETTNEAFVDFLNNALLSLANDRGRFLYFDLDTGDVYVNTEQTGETGPGDGGRTLRVFNSFVNRRITFDSLENEYAVEPEFERHPVTGVSWFGALKYCNWLTLKDGLGASQRAYAEGSHAGDWHAVSISTCDWWGTDDTEGVPDPLPGARDLSDDERLDLVNGFRGYRLPMDGGLAGENPYNEWFKAAAWDAALVVNHVFGIGRDGPLLGAEANFDSSADPFEPGTTPVGFFDGTRYNEGGGGDIGDGSDFPTVEETNPYGLFDMSGNVEEWVETPVPRSPGESALRDRAVRGGSFRSNRTGLACFGDEFHEAPDSIDSDRGFRCCTDPT
ncbi:MAG: SUMF1/EgtB/PvdO family nonheme iron enzyme, partial [Planctomycetes bacterium]|nr:SUMF1/EgtB/PvdO family nonheme iron enzyme [Planctomycetota bacterium]